MVWRHDGFAPPHHHPGCSEWANSTDFSMILSEDFNKVARLGSARESLVLCGIYVLAVFSYFYVQILHTTVPGVHSREFHALCDTVCEERECKLGNVKILLLEPVLALQH